MTVKELIAKLSELPEDAEVTVNDMYSFVVLEIGDVYVNEDGDEVTIEVAEGDDA